MWGICWRAVRLLMQAFWVIFTLLVGVVTLDTGYKPALDDLNNWGMLEPAERAYALGTYLLLNYFEGFVLLILVVAGSAYILVDKPKRRSKRAFDSRRSKFPARKKKRKKP